jgi:hypothetical protein
MAVKVLTSSSLLSASGGKYVQADAYNLTMTSFAASGYWLNFSSATRTINATFANAGNQTGIVLCIRNGYDGVLTIKLKEGTTVRTTDTFDFGATPVSLLNSCSWHYFPLTTYAVTTAASTWSYELSSPTATPLGLVTTASGTDLLYMACTDSSTTKVTTSDTLVVADGVDLTIDESVTHAGTGAFGLILCKDANYKVLNANLTAPITITLSGGLMPSESGSFVVGTSSDPITVAHRVTIDTSGYSGTSVVWGSSSASYWGSTCTNFFEFYGVIDDKVATRIAAPAATGQADIVTTDDMSSDWAIGDNLSIIGKQMATDNALYTISNISGTTITLNTNLNANVSQGGAIVNLNRRDEFGIYIKGPSTLQYWITFTSRVDHIITNGVYLESIGLGTFAAINTLAVASGADTLLFNDNSVALGAYYSIFNGHGGTYKNLFQYSKRNTYSASSFANFLSCNNITVENVYFKNHYQTLVPILLPTTTAPFSVTGNNNTVSGIVVFNGRSSTSYHGAVLYGTAFTVDDINIYFPGGNGLNMAITSSTLNNLTIDGASINNLHISNSFDLTINNPKIGVIAPAATNEVYFLADSLSRVIMNSPTFGSYVNLVDLSTAIPGTYLRIQDFNTTANDCRGYEYYGNYVSTGSGLADTTVHTSGTGKYGLRFEPLSSTNSHTWVFSVPTGNIQNKTINFGVWVKINNANYYSGTHQLPRITADYDNGTIAYTQAAESTDWQLLTLPVTPTTTYGQITITLSARTDQTTSNAYVYWDDFYVAYPPSTSLDLGGFDNWANGLPVTPPIAIPISASAVASQVWEELKASHATSGSMGEQLGKLKNPSLIIDGEVIV